MKHILAIETSCDETAASVVSFNNKRAKILSNIVSSQIDIHKKYGGIIPEVASRAHLETIGLVIKEALAIAKVNLNKIDYFAVTYEPGLIGSLLIGIQTAKTLAWSMNKPLIKINHLNGHFWSAFICHPEGAKRPKDLSRMRVPTFVGDSSLSAQNDNTSIYFKHLDIKFPILSLLVSGGHTQLLLAKDAKNIKIIGQTLDDAAGEAFDKAAQILGLSYPGGPAIAKEADKINQNVIASDGEAISSNASRRSEAFSNKSRDPSASPQDDSQTHSLLPIVDYSLPVPMQDSGDFNFSYSGLKTALLYKYQKLTKKCHSAPHVIPCNDTESIQIDKNLSWIPHPRKSFAQRGRQVRDDKLNNPPAATAPDIARRSRGGRGYQSLIPNLAFSFQKSLVESLVSKTIKAAKKHKPKTITLVGGVAANKYLRDELARNTKYSLPNTKFLVPDQKFCTDNAAMIGIASVVKLKNKAKKDKI